MDALLRIAPAPGRSASAGSGVRCIAAPRGRSPVLATCWALVLALLVGATCAPVGARAGAAEAGHPCHVGAAEPAGAHGRGPAASTLPAAGGPERGTPLESCVRHCRSADHGLQSAAPKAAPIPAPLLALGPAPASRDLPRSGDAAIADAPGRCGPPRASPRPLLHCSLLL